MVISNSYSSTPEKPRWRAFIPTTIAMPIAAYKAIGEQIMRTVNRAGYWSQKQLEADPRIKSRKTHGFDMGKLTPSSLFYLPCQAENPVAQLLHRPQRCQPSAARSVCVGWLCRQPSSTGAGTVGDRCRRPSRRSPNQCSNRCHQRLPQAQTDARDDRGRGGCEDAERSGAASGGSDPDVARHASQERERGILSAWGRSTQRRS